jgi:hypothetical protein
MTNHTDDRSGDAERLRWEIERQRSTLGRDLEALGDHVSPGRMVERRKAAMGHRVRRVRDRLMGAADGAGENLSFAGEAMTGFGEDVASSVRGAPDMVRDRTQGSPLGMGLVSFGIGFVAASLFPATRQEQRLAAKVEPALDRAAEEAGSVARESVDDLRPAAEQAALDLRDDATEAAQHVKDTAQQGVDEVRSEAQHGAEEVTRQAKGPGAGSTPEPWGPGSPS